MIKTIPKSKDVLRNALGNVPENRGAALSVKSKSDQRRNKIHVGSHLLGANPENMLDQFLYFGVRSMFDLANTVFAAPGLVW